MLCGRRSKKTRGGIGIGKAEGGKFVGIIVLFEDDISADMDLPCN